ncbi:MAG: pilus assembly protein [Bacillota bacterium]|nr:pilus assembly protein [Bacillota bacterium]
MTSRRKIWMRVGPAQSERGAVIAWFALAVPLVMMIIAFVCDVAWLSYARGTIQTAADLGALAGLQEIDFDRLAAGEVWIDEKRAAGEALSYLAANLGRGLTPGQTMSSTKSVDVYNTGNLARHGRSRLSHPTVCVTAQVGVRLPVTGVSYVIRVHADASIMPRR